MMINYNILFGVVVFAFLSAHQVIGSEKKTLREVMDDDIKIEKQAKEAEYEFLRDETRKIIFRDLVSNPEILHVSAICSQQLYNIDGAGRHETLYYDCEQCCEHQGKGAWIEDKERALAEGKKCSCKPVNYTRICRDSIDTEKCKRCCLFLNLHEFYSRMDEENSFKDGEECLCKVRFLGETN